MAGGGTSHLPDGRKWVEGLRLNNVGLQEKNYIFYYIYFIINYILYFFVDQLFTILNYYNSDPGLLHYNRTKSTLFGGLI